MRFEREGRSLECSRDGGDAVVDGDAEFEVGSPRAAAERLLRVPPSLAGAAVEPLESLGGRELTAIG